MESAVGNETVSAGPPPSYTPRPVETIIAMLSFFCALGTGGNALVLYVYVRKRNKLPSTIFIIALAATDLSVCLMVMPYTMIVESLRYVITYDILCKIYLFLITSNVPFSAFIMVAIAVDRYLCICHPHRHLLDSRRARLVLISLILLSMVLGVITALAFGVYQYNTNQVGPGDLLNMTSLNETLLNVNIENMTTESNCSHIGFKGLNCSDGFRTELAVMYTGMCTPNELIFSTVFRKTYQKLYAGMFLFAFVVVFVLYIMIYKSVMERRSKKMRQRRKTMSIYRETSLGDSNGPATESSRKRGGPGMEGRKKSSEAGSSRKKGSSVASRHSSRRAMLDRDGCLKEKYWLANIRTALMLFVVTLVFIIAFLPSWLMAHRVVTYNAIVFYLYFAYNVSNPIIYAFMNPAFRRELRDLISCER